MSENNKLDQKKKRLLNKYILEGRLNGSELNETGMKNYIATSRKLEEHKGKFQQKVDEATKRFSHVLTDPNAVRDFPSELLRATALDRYESLKNLGISEFKAGFYVFQFCAKSRTMEDHPPTARLHSLYGTLSRSFTALECLASTSYSWIRCRRQSSNY